MARRTRHADRCIILDTNSISEYMKENADPIFMMWFVAQPFGRMFTTMFNVAELWHGIRLLDPGHKRDELVVSVGGFLRKISGRILTFDRKAARDFSRSAPRFRNTPPAPGPDARTPDVFERVEDLRRERDRGLAAVDLQIASIASSRGFVVATRNTKHFKHTGAMVVNPWKAGEET